MKTIASYKRCLGGMLLFSGTDIALYPDLFDVPLYPLVACEPAGW